MLGNKTTANNGAVAIGGDNSAPVVNIQAGDDASIHVSIGAAAAAKLPSCLGKVIAVFAQNSLIEYGKGERRPLPPEVIQKLEHNNLSVAHRLFSEYRRFTYLIEKAYHGGEQHNADARYLVKRTAGVAYDNALVGAATKFGLSSEKLDTYARTHSSEMISAVIQKLKQDFLATDSTNIDSEVLDLAISLLVADAIADCEVLQRPLNAAAA